MQIILIPGLMNDGWVWRHQFGALSRIAPVTVARTDGCGSLREMAERIRRHQRMRSPDWETVEVPVDLAGWFRKQGQDYRAIVVDCLTLWLSNLGKTGRGDDAVNEQVADLLRAIRGTQALVLLVSNELGFGLVPLGRPARRFRDMAGKVNQRIAAEADEVHFIVSGQTLRLK